MAAASATEVGALVEVGHEYQPDDVPEMKCLVTHVSAMSRKWQ